MDLLFFTCLTFKYLSHNNKEMFLYPSFCVAVIVTRGKSVLDKNLKFIEINERFKLIDFKYIINFLYFFLLSV